MGKDKTIFERARAAVASFGGYQIKRGQRGGFIGTKVSTEEWETSRQLAEENGDSPAALDRTLWRIGLKAVQEGAVELK